MNQPTKNNISISYNVVVGEPWQTNHRRISIRVSLSMQIIQSARTMVVVLVYIEPSPLTAQNPSLMIVVRISLDNVNEPGYYNFFGPPMPTWAQE